MEYEIKHYYRVKYALVCVRHRFLKEPPKDDCERYAPKIIERAYAPLNFIKFRICFFLIMGALGVAMDIIHFITGFPNGLSPTLAACLGLIIAVLDEAKKNPIRKPLIEENPKIPYIIDRLHCRNPRCITGVEQELTQIFKVTDPENHICRCIYCEAKENYED